MFVTYYSLCNFSFIHRFVLALCREAARQEKRETLDGIALNDIEQYNARAWA
jgi:hypothetical protein